jgi:microcystin-dependent protein
MRQKNGISRRLPDLRGRMPVHLGNGPGLSTISWGAKGGNETDTLTTSEIAFHAHDLTEDLTLRGTTLNGVEDSPAGNVPTVEGEGVAMPYSDAAADEDMGTAVDPTTTEGSGGS